MFLRDRKIKKPSVNNNIAILYLPKPVTLKPRSTIEIDMKIQIDFPRDVYEYLNVYVYLNITYYRHLKAI